VYSSWSCARGAHACARERPEEIIPRLTLSLSDRVVFRRYTWCCRCVARASRSGSFNALGVPRGAAGAIVIMELRQPSRVVMIAGPCSPCYASLKRSEGHATLGMSLRR
jgi:hypothetical protein